MSVLLHYILFRCYFSFNSITFLYNFSATRFGDFWLSSENSKHFALFKLPQVEQKLSFDQKAFVLLYKTVVHTIHRHEYGKLSATYRS